MTETSDSAKLEEASERVKVRVHVSPAFRVLSASLLVMAMVGRVVSGVGEGEGEGEGAVSSSVFLTVVVSDSVPA